MKLYPLKFENLYKDYIWGGRNLSILGKELPISGNVAESWELACHKNGTSVIANGESKGITLKEYIDMGKHRVVGRRVSEEYLNKFPLLIKFIDANDKLSVQVHPSDDYAAVNEKGELGKNEMWYILSAEQGATLVAGVKKGVTKESFKQAIQDNKVEECLNYINVKAGDCINIPDGLVHAIGKGIILAEVQQNSDTTYRVYDYNRIGPDGNTRPLHVEKSLETINFSYTGDVCRNAVGLKVSAGEDVNKTIKIANKYFAIEMYETNGGVIAENADGGRFCIYIVCEGNGRIVYKDGEIDIKKGETILIPADMGAYKIEGTLKAIKTYVPDLKKDVIDILMRENYSMDEILKNVEGINQ